MRKALIYLLTLCPAGAWSQPVNGDFENGTSFDLTGVESFCTPYLVQPWSQTHAASSLFAAAIPSREFFNCPVVPPVQIFPSMAIRLAGVQPGENYQLEFWTAATTTNYEACFLAFNYSSPSLGTLPTSEFDLINITGGLINPSITWAQQTFPFSVPNDMPTGADVFAFFTFQQTAGSLAGDYLLVDDIVLNGELSTAIHTPLMQSIPVSPNPTADRLRFSQEEGLNSATVIDALGHSIPLNIIQRFSNVVELDVSDLPAGSYLLRTNSRIGTKAHHFIKQ